MSEPQFSPTYPVDQAAAAYGQSQPTQAYGQSPVPAPAVASNIFAAHAGGDPAVEMIRSKIQAIYADNPDVVQQQPQAEPAIPTGSKHQQYMQQLSASGRSQAEIQRDWYDYYARLPDHEKYEVWDDYQSAGGGANQSFQAITPTASVPTAIAALPAAQFPQPSPFQPQVPQSIPQQSRTRPGPHQPRRTDGQQVADLFKSALSTENVTGIKNRIFSATKSAGSASGGGKLTPKHQLQSLAFGLASGLVVVFIFLFSFFNELIISPFIQPSRTSNETPVIVDVASAVVSGGPKILIPKINVEIPVDYSQTTTDSKQIELALDKGIVHYPTTVKPGETGNAAYFGHSSNNIFNPGKYKFAFVLLNKLVEGDTFYLNRDGKTYAYRVFSSRVVKPSEVSVLGPIAGHPATATLITCDPPGTSINRLVVVGDQISPEPGGNTAPATPATPAPVLAAANDTGLPGNGPTLWARIWGSVF